MDRRALTCSIYPFISAFFLAMIFCFNRPPLASGWGLRISFQCQLDCFGPLILAELLFVFGSNRLYGCQFFLHFRVLSDRWCNCKKGYDRNDHASLTDQRQNRGGGLP